MKPLFDLLSIGLRSDMRNVEVCGLDWDSMVELVQQHGISGVVFYGVKRLKDGCVPGGKTDISALDLGALLMLKEKQERDFLGMWSKTVKFSNKMYENGIRTIAIKGFGVASLYPNPKVRQSCDLDCFLLPVDYDGVDIRVGDNSTTWENANRVMEGEGIEVDRKVYLHSTFDYEGLHVENHQYLTPVKGDKRMQDFELLMRKLLQEEGTTTLGDTHVEIPGLLFSALYVMYHAQKHLFRDEFLLKMVCDWAMIVRRGNTGDADKGLFEWKKLWNVCEQYGMKRFGVCLTGIAHTICGVDLPDGFVRDYMGEELLISYLMGNHKIAKTSANIWLSRFYLLAKIYSSKERYREFSDLSSFQAVMNMIRGRFIDD